MAEKPEKNERAARGAGANPHDAAESNGSARPFSGPDGLPRLHVVACEVFEDEILDLAHPGLSFTFVEQALHRTPELITPALQRIIDRLDERDEELDAVALAYGLCSNGVLGLKSRRFSVVVPRIDDCIGLFLGSREAYVREHSQEPGTYFLTAGWIERARDPLRSYENEYLRKYDEETARWIAGEMLRSYTRIGVIQTRACEQPEVLERAREVADFYDLRLEVLEGSLAYLEKLVQGRWREGAFVVVGPGEELTQEMFFPQLKSSQFSQHTLWKRAAS